MRKIRIIITLRYHFMPTRISQIKKAVHTNVDKDVERLELLYIAGESIKYSTI